MLTALTHTFVYVLDQEEALDFYVGKLGLEVRNDADLGDFRWLTVAVPGQADLEIVLAAPEMGHDAGTAAEIRSLVAKGGVNGVIFRTDDCRGTFERLKAQGVEFTQEPIEQFYGIDCGFRDPFGNPLRFTQPVPGSVTGSAAGGSASAG